MWLRLRGVGQIADEMKGEISKRTKAKKAWSPFALGGTFVCVLAELHLQSPRSREPKAALWNGPLVHFARASPATQHRTRCKSSLNSGCRPLVSVLSETELRES